MLARHLVLCVLPEMLYDVCLWAVDVDGIPARCRGVLEQAMSLTCHNPVQI